MQLQDIIKSNELNYNIKNWRNYNFSKYSLLIPFLTAKQKWNLTLKDLNENQSNLFNELKSIDKGKKLVKRSFQNNIELFRSAREKILKFKSKIFPIKYLEKTLIPISASKPELTPDPTPDSTFE